MSFWPRVVDLGVSGLMCGGGLGGWGMFLGCCCCRCGMAVFVWVVVLVAVVVVPKQVLLFQKVKIWLLVVVIVQCWVWSSLWWYWQRSMRFSSEVFPPFEW